MVGALLHSELVGHLANHDASGTRSRIRVLVGLRSNIWLTYGRTAVEVQV